MPSFFISSTFRDMHPERDVLHKQVFPAIEACARQYGDHVNICDLRWGIDTDELNEQESMHKILTGCLDSIDRCGDYFIGFIGNRYGFVPDKKYLRKIIASHRDIALPEEAISVTELEILYILNQLQKPEDYRHIIFYVRDIQGRTSSRYQSEDIIAAEKIKILKDKLYGISNLTIKDYSLVWDEERDAPTDKSLNIFAEMIRDDLQHMLESDWVPEKGKSAYAKDQRLHLNYAHRKCEGIHLRSNLLQDTESFIDKHIVSAIKGPIGIGKSTLMSQLAVDTENRGDFSHILFGGYTPLTSSAEAILGHMLSILCENLDDIANRTVDCSVLTIPQQLELLDDRLLQYDALLEKERRQSYFFIDAVDQLLPDEQRESLFFITDAFAECRHIHIVVSAVDSFPLPAKIPFITVPELDQDEIIAAAGRIAGIEFKELNASVRRSILAQSMSRNPLYLSLLVKRLLLMDQMDFEAIDKLGNVGNPISSYQGRLVSQLNTALYGICREITELASKRIGGEMVQKCLSYLAVSRYGLTEAELEKLFEKHGQQFCYADFAMFIRYLDLFFIRRMDGKIDFSHKSLRLGILEQYTDNQTYLHSVHLKLAVLFSEEPEGPSDIEMYWHLLEAEDYHSFYENLNLIKTIDVQCTRMAAIVKQWLILGHNEDDLLEYPVQSRSVDLFNDLSVLVNHYIFYQLKGGEKDRKLALTLVQKLYENGQVLESLGIKCQIVSNEHFLRNMVIIRNVLAEIILKERTEDALRKAIGYLEMNLPYLETEPTDPGLRHEVLYKDRITDYERLSDLYEYIGGEDNLKKAHCYLSMAVETVEAYVEAQENEDSLTTMLSIYLRMAKQCELLAIPTLSLSANAKNRDASFYYEQSYELLERTVLLTDQLNEEDSNYIETLDAVAYGYDALAEYYFELRDQKHLKMAEELCLKSIHVGKSISRLQGSISRKTIQGASYLRLALIYEELDMDMQEKDKLIEQNLQRGCYIYKSLMEELGTADARRDYAISLGRMALHYHDLADEKSLNKGLRCMDECLAIYEALVKTMPTPTLKDGLAKEKGIKADLLKAIHTKSSFIKAYKIYKEVLVLRKEIYKEAKSGANLREIAFVYSKLAEILLDIDDERYASKALCYLQKDLKFLHVIARGGETIENLNDFQDAYEFVGRCYKAMKLDNPSFAKAIQYQKKYIEKCQRAREIDPCEDTIFNLSVAYENLADLHYHRKGRYHLYQAEKYARKSYRLFKEYEMLCGADQCHVEWAVFFNHIGAIYLERYGIEPKAQYLKKSYAFLRRSLKINAGADQEEVLVSIKNLAEHPYTSGEMRKHYAVKAYRMAETRYQETELDWYRVMMRDLEKVAKKYGIDL